MNLYKINGLDVFTTWGLSFGPGTYEELLKNAKRKEGYSRNWPDENGTERDVSTIYFESRNLSLPISITAQNGTDFYTKYNAFKNFLYTSGYFDLDVVQMNRRFKLLYLDMTQFVKITNIEQTSEVACSFTLSLVDDFPTTLTTIA